MILQLRQGDVRTFLDAALPPAAVGLAWLGQAGFAVKSSRLLMLIDPYLSDSLAEKYRGCEFPHVRQMPPPIDPDELRGVGVVLCTHRHSDHLDPGTLPLIARNNPACWFVVPRAERASAERIGLPPERLVAIDAADEPVRILASTQMESSSSASGDVEIRAVPSAHETLERNDRGEHRFLGYILRLAGATIYHSGDCVPYPGLTDRLRPERIDLGLLPVNGRDAYRRERGVPGNMTFDEALALCVDAAISRLIPHHFGMFDFNTVAPAELAARAAATPHGVVAILPRSDVWLELDRGTAILGK